MKNRFRSYGYIFPNFFTTGNLFCGFLSIIKSIQGDYIFSAYLIIGAALFDLVDGRVARIVKSVSSFGKEYDSLSDIVSFGVAPVILIYNKYLYIYPKLGWLICFLFLSCGALRLARFNIFDKETNIYFTGLPIPVAAVSFASFVLFHNTIYIENKILGIVLVSMLVVKSFLMISSVEYKSYKTTVTNLENNFYKIVFFVLAFIVIALRPEVLLFIITSLYIILGFLVFYIRKINFYLKFKAKKIKK